MKRAAREGYKGEREDEDMVRQHGSGSYGREAVGD